jgi:hypothetical protein
MSGYLIGPEYYPILADACDNPLEMWIRRDLQCDTANGGILHHPCRRLRMALLARRKRQKSVTTTLSLT